MAPAMTPVSRSAIRSASDETPPEAMTFIPGMSDAETAPYGQFDWANVNILKGFIDNYGGNYDTVWPYDLGVITLKEPIGDTVGWLGYWHYADLGDFTANIIGYPYDKTMPDGDYETAIEALQIELVKLQQWTIAAGERIVIVFEGRDAAGKGGTIKRFIEHLNPRAARVVALTKPSSDELGQWYFQRYIRHFPTSGEIVLFDRSWYNRAGVERVMGFCNPDEYAEFMESVVLFEQLLAHSGVTILKYYLDISRKALIYRMEKHGIRRKSLEEEEDPGKGDSAPSSAA